MPTPWSPLAQSTRRRRAAARPRRGRALLTVAVTVACAGAGAFTWTAFSSGSPVHGLSDGAVLGASAVDRLNLYLDGAGADHAGKIRVTLDGTPVATRADGARLRLAMPALADGPHEMVVLGHGSLPFVPAKRRLAFRVDSTPPALRLEPARAATLRSPVTVTGTAKGAAEITVDGRKVGTDHAGVFTATVTRPAAVVKVSATDLAGNTVTKEARAQVTHPPMRAAHITSIGWADATLRGRILALVKSGRLNAVQLDIKDEDGEVGYASRVPRARSIGAAKGYYDAREAIADIHAAGAQVVGRIVAFRDPLLAGASWKAGRHDEVVQTPAGLPYGGSDYGAMAFTNFASPAVRQYNEDLATEAAKLGFDDILYDYVRRPDGPLSRMRFPGLGALSPERSIAGFVADTRAAVRPQGAFLGVSVFGIAATRPKEIGQDITALARASDYIAPMVYPSHWGPGEYDVSDPGSAPYAIVRRSLKDFADRTRGTRSQIIPWLQDFSMGVHYGPEQVAEQIKAAADNKMDSFILWNAGASYQETALAVLRTHEELKKPERPAVPSVKLSH
ncbi:putative glycoside hydrolase [Streptomyces sp. NPDC088725]|uniref:putative glycoside hydrolase n=1 Tax=Streptomyces sp. NPDC088725 TaxID=3365873 RepID=UPI00380F305A